VIALLITTVEALLPLALAQMHQHPIEDVAATAETAVRQYVPAPGDRAQLVAIVRRVIEKLEATP
jgi:hypothetical protein